MRTLLGVARRAVGLGILGITLCGCAILPNPERFGIRPDEPFPLMAEDPDPCVVYDQYVIYVQELQEAYHSRASQNRGWIYVAAILGLSVAAAAGGLGIAAAASAGTIALLTLTGGAGTGFFTIIDNPTLAEVYTISANRLDAALNDPSQGLSQLAASGPAGCTAALEQLRGRVSAVRSDLEAARTDSAKAALIRAAAQQESVKRQAAALGLVAFELIPSRTQLGPGQSAIVVINGGRPDYRVTVVGAALTVAQQPTRANLYQAIIEAKKEAPNGEYDVLFQDSESRVRTLRFEVTSAPSTKAPQPLTVRPLTGQTVALVGLRTLAFVVSGGKPPYTSMGPTDAKSQSAIAVNPDALKELPADQPIITITVQDGAGPGSYTASVVDSAKDSKALTITVASKLALVPEGVLTIEKGTKVRIAVAGGQPPYRARTSSESLKATMLANYENIIEIDATQAEPGSYTATVRDDLGQEISMPIGVVTKR